MASARAAVPVGQSLIRAHHRFTDAERVKNTITLGHKDTIKVSLTTKEGSKAKRPHQAFLIIKEASGLEAPFPLTVKESGRGTVKIVRMTAPGRARI